MPFTCNICGEESTRICVRCTKDACDNHLCEKCLRCSDCCECEVRLSQPARVAPAASYGRAPSPEPTLEPEAESQAAPEPPVPGPDPDPDPAPDPEEPAPVGP